MVAHPQAGGRSFTRRLGPGVRAVSVLGLTLALASCSGTPLGERLASSFSAPAGGAASTTPSTTTPSTAAAPAVPTPAAPSASTQPAAAGASTAQPPADAKPGQPAATAAAGAPPRTSSSGKPVKPATTPRPPGGGSAAYRVTIRLPGADPSAPAEAVTEALRSAGVSFEVETIERMPAEGSRSGTGAATSPAPVSSPAPAPR
jgi:hypothetical protein